MSPPSPVVAQWELAIRLRERRRSLGKDAGTVSRALDVSRNYWSAVENDRSILASEKIADLGPVLDFSEHEVAELQQLQELARRPRWWSEYDSLLSDDLMKVIGLEYGAERIHVYEAQLITGLLQTDEYANELFATDPAVSQASSNQRLRLRKQRQQRLIDDDPVHLTVLMNEAALRQQYGTRGVLRRQLEHVVDLVSELAETLEIRVMPFTAHPLGLTGASTLYLLDFASKHLPTALWREAVTPIGITEDREEVETVRVSYQQAMDESSLAQHESLQMIQERISELR